MSTATHTKQQVMSLTDRRYAHARAIAKAGGLDEAIAAGTLPGRIDTTLSEAIVLGLLRQGVKRYFAVFGHGSTEMAEVLRIYGEAGVIKTYAMRHETAAAHAATALRWVTGEKAAVITSIGPGALHAMAGSLASSSDGVGVWHLYGDETTHDEGPNMQQIPRAEQQLYLKLCSTMGGAYCLHTAEAVGVALRRGLNVVDHSHQAGPFYLLLPMNCQPQEMADFNLDELPCGAPPKLGAAGVEEAYEQAAKALLAAKRVVVKVGGGARQAGAELVKLLELVDGVAVTSPLVSGVIAYQHPRNMTVGGSKGSIAGNHAMEEADLLVAIGSRFVCQADCSRTGYPKVQQVININADVASAMHYNKTIALIGDAAATLAKLNETIERLGGKAGGTESAWFTACAKKKQEWDAFKAERYNKPRLKDERWGDKVMTQPAAIKAATDWARKHDDVVNLFDAGDVQANGFQVVEDDRLGRTFTETGASYMGFAVSAVMASAVTDRPFYALAYTGDGSFTMNPQILIDGVEHGARGCILLMDNRRMGAISGLQQAQYGTDYATNDQVEVDYLAWAKAVKGVNALDGGDSPQSLTAALEKAKVYKGLSLIYVRVYYGSDPLGGLGAFGRWNVGNWSVATQALRHDIGL